MPSMNDDTKKVVQREEDSVLPLFTKVHRKRRVLLGVLYMRKHCL